MIGIIHDAPLFLWHFFQWVPVLARHCLGRLYAVLLKAVFFCPKAGWIFLCDEIALPEIWKSDVREVEIILCEFTRVMLYLSHIPLALIDRVQHQCLWCLFDNCHGQCGQWLHLQEACHYHQAGHTILRIHTGNRKLWRKWIFLCDEIALPEIWKSDVRKVEII